MGLGGEVDRRIAALDRPGDHLGITDVSLDELETGGVDPFEVLPPAGVGQLVQNGHLGARILLEQGADEGRSDEAGSPGDQDLHRTAPGSPCERAAR